VDFAWPSSPATVGAYIASEAGRPLTPGERLEVGGLAVEIESTDATGVTSAIVTPPHLDDQGEPDADAEDRDSSSVQPS
jgi:CBS domain containing-hemolysin-like protein